MVNVRCQACQAKYRLLAAKRVNLLGLALEPRPVNLKGDLQTLGHTGDKYLSELGIKPTPRFPYRPPIQRRPRSYILPPGSRVLFFSPRLFLIRTWEKVISGKRLIKQKHSLSSLKKRGEPEADIIVWSSLYCFSSHHFNRLYDFILDVTSDEKGKRGLKN